MKKGFWLFFLGCILSKILYAQPSVTFTVPRGRLGNKLIAYLKANFIAEKYHFKLLVPNFPYADQLKLSSLNESFNEGGHEKFTVIKPIKSEREITEKKLSDVLYIVDFNFQCNIIAWAKNPRFRNIARTMIRPIFLNDPVTIPTNKITIAIHVRRGGDYDERRPWMIEKLPHKFPPIRTYKQKLEKLIHQLPKRPIHIHIFTDDSNPRTIAQELTSSLNNKSISVSYRETGNHHAANVLEDLDAMAKCNYLIRPHSTYSMIAEIIGFHKKIIVA